MPKINSTKTLNYLMIVESPNKVKSISQFLPNNYKVMASVGHISELSDKKGSYWNTGIEPDNNFKMDINVSSDKKDVVKKLKDAVDKADLVYICSDPDREGEAIAWSLKKFLKIPKDKCKRATFHEITKNAVLKALENASDIDDDLVDASHCRMCVDKMVGYRLSPIARKSVSAKSVGRCQSAGLKILVDREMEIQNFKPEKYFDVYLHFNKNMHPYKAKYFGTTKKEVKRITDESVAKAIANDCKGKDYIIKDITTKDKISNAKAPFTTSTFQQEVSSKLGVSVKTAMSYAQRLFEGIDINGQHIALTTYLRTDSTDMSKDFMPILENYVKTNYGQAYYAPLKKVKQAANVQAGHECFRVVDLNVTKDYLKNYISDEKLLKVYDMIWRRTVQSMMAPSITAETTYSIVNGDHKFTFVSQELKFDGYKKVYTYKESDNDDDELAKDSFSVDEKLQETSLESLEKSTQPPSRYKEATFIKALESSGIGRPSTFSSIVSTLLDEKRGYCKVENKCMMPTEKGITLSKYLDKTFPNFISLTYTADLEKELDSIATGKLKKLDFLNDFYNKLETSAKAATKSSTSSQSKAPKVPAVVVKGVKCPKCGGPMVLRKGPYGEFYGCKSYPKCRGILPKEDK